MSQSRKQFTEVKLSVPWGHVAAKVYSPLKEKKILVVHGILDNAGSFDRLIELLPQEYQYVSIDLPGHGFSSPFPSGLPVKFFDYVYTILLVLDTLKWKSCIYLAHSLGAQIGSHFSVIYPGRLERIIALDGFMPTPVENAVSATQEIYNLSAYSNVRDTLYTKKEVIYALQYKRKEALNADAAEAMFTRATTKVGDLYKYNRDPRLRMMVRPTFNMQIVGQFCEKFATPILIILAERSHNIDILKDMVEKAKSVIKDKREFNIVFVKGNHDVHNNYPERVAPYIYDVLKNNTKSKL